MNYRKILQIIVLFCYLVMTFGYLRPLISHHINFEYIVNYLCEEKDKEVNSCKGSCHLSDEIIDELKKEESETHDKATISNIKPIAPHHLATNNQLIRKSKGDESLLTKNSSLITRFLEPLIPPPKNYS